MSPSASKSPACLGRYHCHALTILNRMLNFLFGVSLSFPVRPREKLIYTPSGRNHLPGRLPPHRPKQRQRRGSYEPRARSKPAQLAARRTGRDRAAAADRLAHIHERRVPRNPLQAHPVTQALVHLVASARAQQRGVPAHGRHPTAFALPGGQSGPIGRGPQSERESLGAAGPGVRGM